MESTKMRMKPSVNRLLLCVAVCGGVASGATSRVSFNSPRAYPVNANQSIAVGDFNGDGRPDIAASDGASNLYIFLQQSDGTFAPPVLYPVARPNSITVADFNGDHKLDLAVANFDTPGTVSILLGNGDGTFQGAVTFPAGTEPYGTAAGDFNGDGKLDLAVTNFGSATVSILLGNGDGTFQPQTTVSLGGGTGPAGIAVGDFNHDGKADLVTTNELTSTVSVLLGLGNGEFASAVSYPVGGLSASVAVADFNNDGKQDLAVASPGNLEISILLGNGNGTFQPAVNIPVNGGSPQTVAVADFNGDGKPDMAVGLQDEATVAIYLGNGDGTFKQPKSYPAGQCNSTHCGPTLAVADFNGDGKPDLASPVVTVLLGKGDGTFDHPTDYSADGPVSVAAADFNGDGRMDLAVAGNPSQGSPPFVTIWLGQPNGGLLKGATYHVKGVGDLAPMWVAVGDFNGDGNIDLVVTASAAGKVDILLGNGDGTFQAPVTYATGGKRPQFVAVGDFNGDGKPDLVVTNTGSESVGVLLGNGDGTFQTAVNYGVGNIPTAVAIGDFNNDGKPDLAAGIGCSSCGGGFAIFLGNGDGTFQPPTIYITDNYVPTLATADLNGDGNLDLVIGENAIVGVVFGHGDGTFGPTVYSYPCGSGTENLVLADFNGDGNMDVAAVGDGESVTVLLGAADGSFGPGVSFLVAAGPVALAAANFNGSEKPDLAVADVTSSTITLLTNTSH